MTYSVWLRLSGESQIQTAIVQTALKYGTPVFPAHITVSSRLETLEEAVDFARLFVAHKPQYIRINTRPYAVCENSRWQTTVVLRVLSLDLDDLPYPPHISLVYHDTADDNIRTQMADDLCSLLQNLPEQLSTAAVQVWQTAGGYQDICQWKQIRESFKECSYFDVAVNLTDAMFSGVYNEKVKHLCDRKAVVERALAVGCDRMLLLGGSIEDSSMQLELARELDPDKNHLFTTVGVHPTRTTDFSADRDLPRLGEIINSNLDRVVAVGEIGLDADRLHFASMDNQIAAFESQLSLAKLYILPVLLHFRGSSSFDHFINILTRHSPLTGVVHSFTGTRDQMTIITSQLNLAIGVNGCSLRDQVFLTDVLPYIPKHLLVIETDAPYCDIRPTHPSFEYLSNPAITTKPEKWTPGCLVKGRNEPCLISQVAEIVRKLHPAGEEAISAAYENALRIFPRSSA